MSQPSPEGAPSPHDVPLFDLDQTGRPLLPYAGTSGWSGSDTSKARAVTADRDGTTSARQKAVLELLSWQGSLGVTWREVADRLDLHHGSASGVLSVLHKEGVIARLAEARDRCKVYVLPSYVEGRATEPHGRKAHACPNCGWEESA